MSSDEFQLDENLLFFLSEGREFIEDAEPKLIELEQTSQENGMVDEESLNTVFRLFHSLKGSAGFLQLDNVVRVTHQAEALLEIIRSGKASLKPHHIDNLCRACDIVQVLFDFIEENGHDLGHQKQVEAMARELELLIESECGPGGEAPDNQAGQDMELSLTPEMISRFIQESEEQLDIVEQALLKLEKDPDQVEDVEEAFRALHSFKGNCGFMSQAPMERLSHSLENVLSGIKDEIIKPDEDNIPVMLHLVDVLKETLAVVAKGDKGAIEHQSILHDMLRDVAPMPETGPDGEIRPEIVQEEALWLLRQDAGETPPQPQTPKKPIEKTAPPALKNRSTSRRDIRVDLSKLDSLINLVGELVIAESMVTKNPDLEGLELESFDKSAGHLHKIVRDLQDMALSVRMIPLAGVFRKMIRLVRDLAARSGKQVNLTLLGEETEIDKTLAELIADPLVHMVRNAVDHGIGTVEERRAQGKPATGEITLEAKHEGGEVWILIKDDGQGLDRKGIMKKAYERGLVTDESEDLSDQEVFEFIFHPGFSTAQEVTDISGRGVGMDVVKKNIEKMKGHIDIRSKPDEGTTFAMRIPLTLAILDGMLIRVGHARYTLPMLSIRESIQVEPDWITITMDGQEMVRVRDEILPVVRLHKLHNLTPDSEELTEGLLVIMEHQQETIGLFVDEVLGEQQAVIKGLSNFIGNVKGVSGCTILGNGEVSLILDVPGIISKAMAETAA